MLSRLSSAINDSGERLYELHFYEQWDETMYLTEKELNECKNLLQTYNN